MPISSSSLCSNTPVFQSLTARSLQFPLRNPLLHWTRFGHLIHSAPLHLPLPATTCLFSTVALSHLCCPASRTPLHSPSPCSLIIHSVSTNKPVITVLCLKSVFWVQHTTASLRQNDLAIMDPADSDSLRLTLSSQEELLCKHDHLLSNLLDNSTALVRQESSPALPAAPLDLLRSSHPLSSPPSAIASHCLPLLHCCPQPPPLPCFPDPTPFTEPLFPLLTYLLTLSPLINL
ncbi:uncharacterized protein LOC144464301 isoform X2 [Epinephelus lanceolatus]